MAIREAAHAGSWYSSNGSQLTTQLDSWLDQVDETALPGGTLPFPSARVVISPHAGYAYSGPCAAWAYKSLNLSKAKRIFILHPSHHHYLRTAALPVVQAYETPLSNDPLLLDLETIKTLSAKTSGDGRVKFTTMSQSVDEAEHSGEMQLPYIHRLLQKLYPNEPTSAYPPLVPIMIGATDAKVEVELGKILAPYVADESNAFVISSDFCHWGSRFSYTYYFSESPTPEEPPTALPNGVQGDPTVTDIHTKHDWSRAEHLRSSKAPLSPKIYESIGYVDRACMCAIATGKHADFLNTIEATGNTVCGRHPIGVFMAAVEQIEKADPGLVSADATKRRFRFMRYERSENVTNARNSSVSYVSAFAVM